MASIDNDSLGSGVLEMVNRWQKLHSQNELPKMPGVDQVFLAMDSDDGVEVEWNEVYYTPSKFISTPEELANRVKARLDLLVALEHPNLIKLRAYWTDLHDAKLRLVFITEHVTCGSLKNYLKKINRSTRTFITWRRWCLQILSALSYLHSLVPYITHGNLTCDTIYINHNGLIKLSPVALGLLSSTVKAQAHQQFLRHMHYMAPELWLDANSPSPSASAGSLDSESVAELPFKSTEHVHMHLPSELRRRSIPRDSIDSSSHFSLQHSHLNSISSALGGGSGGLDGAASSELAAPAEDERASFTRSVSIPKPGGEEATLATASVVSASNPSLVTSSSVASLHPPLPHAGAPALVRFKVSSPQVSADDLASGFTASTETDGAHTARTDDADSVDAALEVGAMLAGSPASDIYAFGVCALEMAAFEGAAFPQHFLATEMLQKLRSELETLIALAPEEGPQRAMLVAQHELVEPCLTWSPGDRPTALDLLLHPTILEVPSLRLLSAYAIEADKKLRAEIAAAREALGENELFARDPNAVFGQTVHEGAEPVTFRYSEIHPTYTNLSKFLDDVNNGCYPMNFYEPHIYRPSYYSNYCSPTGHSASARAGVPSAALAPGLLAVHAGAGALGGFSTTGHELSLSLLHAPHHVPSAPGLQTAFQQRFHVEHVHEPRPHPHAPHAAEPSAPQQAQHTANANLNLNADPNALPTQHQNQTPGELQPHMTLQQAQQPAAPAAAAAAAVGSQPATLVQPSTINAKQRHPTPGNLAGAADAHLFVQSIPIPMSHADLSQQQQQQPGAAPGPISVSAAVAVAAYPHADAQQHYQQQLPIFYTDGAPHQQPVQQPEAQFQQPQQVPHPEAHLPQPVAMGFPLEIGGQQQHNHVDGQHPAMQQQQQQLDRTDASSASNGLLHGFHWQEDGLLHPGPIDCVLRCTIERVPDADLNEIRLLLVVRMRVLVACNGHLATVPELGGSVEAEQQQQQQPHQTRHIDRRIVCALDGHDTPYTLTHELVHCALVLETDQELLFKAISNAWHLFLDSLQPAPLSQQQMQMQQLPQPQPAGAPYMPQPQPVRLLQQQ